MDRIDHHQSENEMSVSLVPRAEVMTSELSRGLVINDEVTRHPSISSLTSRHSNHANHDSLMLFHQENFDHQEQGSEESHSKQELHSSPVHLMPLPSNSDSDKNRRNRTEGIEHDNSSHSINVNCNKMSCDIDTNNNANKLAGSTILASSFPLISNISLPGGHQRSDSLTSLISRRSSTPNSHHPSLSQNSSVSTNYDRNPNYQPSHQSNLYKLCLSRSSIGSNVSIESFVSSSSFISCSCGHLHYPKNAKTAAFIVASSIYGQLLVVICLAFFTAKTTTNKIPLVYFEGFYLYLYSGSLIFLFYVYVYLLNDDPSDGQQTGSRGGKNRKRKISETDKSHGSIFLRIGAIGFGLGTMIYNGLEFGSYLETPATSPCYSILIGVNPFLQGTFTFAQMYFIFTYSRLMINKFKLLARLGLMHLVATNICTWIRTLGKETLQELRAGRNLPGTGYGSNRLNSSLFSHGRVESSRDYFFSNVTEENCQKEDIMEGILKNVSPYLYPFIVEYSLIGAAFLYVMWSNIGRSGSSSGGHHTRPFTVVSGTNGGTANTTVAASPARNGGGGEEGGNHHPSVLLSPSSPFSIDNLSTSSRTTSASNHSLYSCLGSSKGLFSGFLFLVFSITSLIVFFVLIHHPSYHKLATITSEVTHSILLVSCSLATLVAFIKIRRLKFQPGLNETADSGLRDILLKVAGFGLYVYALFGVIAGLMQPYSMPHVAVLVTSGLTIFQVTLQSLFISDVVCRRRMGNKEPGRQLITFLLITNFTLWIIYTFEMQKVEASPVQMSTYGFPTWALIVRFTLPLSIFYRFHSAITFAEIWKNSYK